MMNILLLATSDEQGAGIVARYTNEGFIKAGHNSVLIVKESDLKNDNVIVLNKPVGKHSFKFYYLKIKSKLENIYSRLNPVNREEKYFFHNLNERHTSVKASRILKKITFKPDVIFVLWISNYVNTKTINDLHTATGAKIVWLMTDNAPLTGGCHYPWDCKGYQTDCSDCPALIHPGKKIIAKKNLAFKKKHLPQNLELVPGSEIDYQKALKASVFKGHKIHKLLAPIDGEKFVPADKSRAKSLLGIDPGKKVIFYGVQLFSDIRKGMQYFLEAVRIFERKTEEEKPGSLQNYLLLLAGYGDEDFTKHLAVPFLHLGFLNEENLVKAYQAADIYVCSSVQDSGPLMINQSVMCGTPVVAFEMGVAFDLVHTGKTGYRAKLADAADMAAGIRTILSLPQNDFQEMCTHCRILAENNFTMKMYTKNLLNLIKVQSQ